MVLIIFPACFAIIIAGLIGSISLSESVIRACEVLFIVAYTVILAAILWQFCKTAITTVDSLSLTATTTLIRQGVSS
ncbi:hypothetical protein [Actinomyces procaprae]|uniref:hypothetical protein n=1 Tax=Actinomyces procaprae TaxID=2560010 RepID=UPI00109DDA6E|nr:hypothetical protein [Actinomyces procaprae]